MRNRPDLIVPAQDRRRGKRIVTIKNVAVAGGVVAVLFVGITIRSEMRDSNPGAYGSLYDHQVPADVNVKAAEVITEAPAIDDREHADPMLLSAAAREQYLRTADQRPKFTAADRPAVAPAVAPLRAGEGDVAIVGGPEGVTAVKTDTSKDRPKLTGGIFKSSTVN
jgi:hypothetical protein